MTHWYGLGAFVGLAVALGACSGGSSTGTGDGGLAGGTGGASGSGSGGTGTGGTGTGGTGTGGTGSCTPNLGCTLAAPASTGDPAQDCVNRINQFRTQCACLPALQRWTDGEACADQMAQYDSEHPQSAHQGFRDQICDGGWAQNECPGWGSAGEVVGGCLQMMWDEGPGPAGCADDSACFQQHGHHINMTNTGYTKVACGFYDASGDMWSVQNFK